jgi:hypothetical protein
MPRSSGGQRIGGSAWGIHLERARVAYENREEQRAAWATDAGAVSWEDLQAAWGLSTAEMHAAARA